MKEENETSEAAGDNHETTVVTNSCAFEGEVVDRVYAAEVGTDEQELTEREAAEGGIDKQQEPRDTLAGGSNPYSNDPGVWGDRINQQVKSYWATLGPKNCQNKDCDFSASERQYCYDPVGLDMYSCPCFCCALCFLQAGWRAAEWGSDSIGRLGVPAL